MTAPISRTQVWCKLAVLIAEGAPAPREVSFDEAGPMVKVEIADHVTAWAKAAGVEVRPPFTSSTGTTSYKAYGQWHGLELMVTAYVRPETAPEPVTEDMSRVREVAEHGQPLTDEAMDGALLYLADQLNRHPEVLDDERTGAVTE